MKPQSTSVLSSAPKSQVRRTLSLPQLPLAIYREVAAHLRQVDGVNTGLILRSGSEFNYDLSQVERMWIEYAEDLSADNLGWVEQILAYYGDRYGVWQLINED